MSQIKAPQSPSILYTLKNQQQNNNQLKITQSVKVQKSRNSIIEDQDEQITVFKQKTYQGDFQQYDNQLQQKLSPNETKIFINNNDQSNSIQIRNNTDEAMIFDQNICCFCGEKTNIFPICQCSQAHQKCANEFLQQGPYLEQIQCKKCNQYRHVNGVIYFDFSQWKLSKFSLIFEFLFLLVILAIFGILTYYSFFELYEKFVSDRLLISCLVFSYTLWFILLICLISKILNHFKKVKLLIKRFDPKNVQFNQNYVNLVIKV